MYMYYVMNSLSFGMIHDANISVMFDLVSKSIHLFFDDMCFLLGLFPFLHRIILSKNFHNIFSINYFSFQNWITSLTLGIIHGLHDNDVTHRAVTCHVRWCNDMQMLPSECWDIREPVIIAREEHTKLFTQLI